MFSLSLYLFRIHGKMHPAYLRVKLCRGCKTITRTLVCYLSLVTRSSLLSPFRQPIQNLERTLLEACSKGNHCLRYSHHVRPTLTCPAEHVLHCSRAHCWISRSIIVCEPSSTSITSRGTSSYHHRLQIRSTMQSIRHLFKRSS